MNLSAVIPPENALLLTWQRAMISTRSLSRSSRTMSLTKVLLPVPATPHTFSPSPRLTASRACYSFRSVHQGTGGGSSPLLVGRAGVKSNKVLLSFWMISARATVSLHCSPKSFEEDFRQFA